MALFLVSYFLVEGYRFIPEFAINDYYKTSGDFLWMLGIRLSFLFLILVVYVMITEPKEFKYALMGISTLLLMSIIEVLPFGDGDMSYYTYYFLVAVSFCFIWLTTLVIEKVRNKYFYYIVFFELQSKKRDNYLDLLRVNMYKQGYSHIEIKNLQEGIEKDLKKDFS